MKLVGSIFSKDLLIEKKALPDNQSERYLVTTN